jgi:hypothetical protein
MLQNYEKLRATAKNSSFFWRDEAFLLSQTADAARE